MRQTNCRNKTILIAPVAAVRGEIAGSTAYYVLCVSEAEMNAETGNALWLSFADTEDSAHPEAFRAEQAGRILKFFQRIPAGSDIFICCDSGESRSAAIAAALKRIQGQSEFDIWTDPAYHPNGYVYKLSCRVFGNPVSEKDLLQRKAINREALRRAVEAETSRYNYEKPV